MAKTSKKIDLSDKYIRENVMPHIVKGRMGERIHDDTVTGLYVRYTESGSIRFSLGYTPADGKPWKEKSLGKWSVSPHRNKTTELNVTEARAKARTELGACAIFGDDYAKQERIRKQQEQQLKDEQAQAELESQEAMPTMGEFLTEPAPELYPEWDFWRIRSNKISDAYAQKIDCQREFKHFYDVPLNKITKPMIEAYINTRVKSKGNPKGISWITVRRYCNTLSSILNMAVDMGWIERNFYLDIKKIKVDSDKEPEIMSVANQEKIFSQLRIRDAEMRAAAWVAYENLQHPINAERRATKAARKGMPMTPITPPPEFFIDYLEPWLIVCRETGMRNIEIFRLRWGMVNLETAVITLTGDITKNKKSRSFVLSQDAIDALRKWNSQQKDAGLSNKHELIFPSPSPQSKGQQMKKLGSSYTKLCKNAGVNIREANAYRFRRTMVTDLIASGADMKVSADIIGNNPTVMQRAYLKSRGVQATIPAMENLKNYRQTKTAS